MLPALELSGIFFSVAGGKLAVTGGWLKLELWGKASFGLRTSGAGIAGASVMVTTGELFFLSGAGWAEAWTGTLTSDMEAGSVHDFALPSVILLGDVIVALGDIGLAASGESGVK